MGAFLAASLVSSDALPVASNDEITYAGRIIANMNGATQWPLVAVPPESLRNPRGWVGCLTINSAPMMATTQMISATTPRLFSNAAALTPATFTNVPATIRPNAHGRVCSGVSRLTPNQPAMNGAIATATVVTATVCAMMSHHPVCHASQGLPVMRPVIWYTPPASG